MSNVHVLNSEPSTGSTRVAFHFPVPVGNNAAAISWANAVVAAGLNTTIMSVGSGGGQLSQIEATQIAAGSVVEFVTEFLPDPFSNAARLAQIDALYTATQTQVAADLRARLAYYGFTR